MFRYASAREVSVPTDCINAIINFLLLFFDILQLNYKLGNALKVMLEQLNYKLGNALKVMLEQYKHFVV